MELADDRDCFFVEQHQGEERKERERREPGASTRDATPRRPTGPRSADPRQMPGHRADRHVGGPLTPSVGFRSSDRRAASGSGTACPTGSHF
jgi:hypothetical protein